MMDKQIMKYIPQSKIEAIEDAFRDSDGIWIYLKDEWEASRFDKGCHIIHEDDIKHLRYQIAGIRRRV